MSSSRRTPRRPAWRSRWPAHEQNTSKYREAENGCSGTKRRRISFSICEPPPTLSAEDRRQPSVQRSGPGGRRPACRTAARRPIGPCRCGPARADRPLRFRVFLPRDVERLTNRVPRVIIVSPHSDKSRSGGMADAEVSKTFGGNLVGVRVPPSAEENRTQGSRRT